jgi:hypothetical protein
MINHAVREVLDSYTLAQMADDRWLETMSRRLEEVTGARPVQPLPTRAGAQPSRHTLEPVTAARGVGSTPCGRPMPVEPAPRKKTRSAPRSKKSSK